jgi:hypothetical protein
MEAQRMKEEWERDGPDSGLTHSLALVSALSLLGLELIDRETSDTTRHGSGGDNPLLSLLEHILLARSAAGVSTCTA